VDLPARSRSLANGGAIPPTKCRAFGDQTLENADTESGYDVTHAEALPFIGTAAALVESMKQYPRICQK